MNYRAELVKALADQLVPLGYRVYIAQSGTHGFYTDGIRVVSFQCGLGVLEFSGNYGTSLPKQTGTGWRFDVKQDRMDADLAHALIAAHAPHWAVGHAHVRYTTPEQYLATYHPSSKYTEIK